MTDAIEAHVAKVLAAPFSGHTNVWREQHVKTARLDVGAFLKALQQPAFMALAGLVPPRPEIEEELRKAAERAGKARSILKEMKAAARGPLSVEFQLGFAYLASIGLADEFLDFCHAHGFGADWVVARNFYYARNVVGLHRMESDQPATILEFGAGSGALAIILHRLGLVRRYVIVDLPEVLAYSATQVRKWLPEASIAFGPGPEADFTFVSPDEIDGLSGPIDMALNFISFAEMEKRWVDAYFALVYRLARPGALFYNVNRTHQNLRQSDGSQFYSHPLLYPYQPDDDLVMWDVDPLQDHSRAWVNARPANPAYARACRVHGKGRRLLMPATALHSYPLAELQSALPNWRPWSPA
jgi:hypothetical protein